MEVANIRETSSFPCNPLHGIYSICSRAICNSYFSLKMGEGGGVYVLFERYIHSGGNSTRRDHRVSLNKSRFNSIPKLKIRSSQSGRGKKYIGILEREDNLKIERNSNIQLYRLGDKSENDEKFVIVARIRRLTSPFNPLRYDEAGYPRISRLRIESKSIKTFSSSPTSTVLTTQVTGIR